MSEKWWESQTSSADDWGSETPSANANNPTAGYNKGSGTGNTKKDPPPVIWWKGILAIAAAIVTIGGATAVISKTTHWLDGVFSSSSPSFTSVERSPILGISFYQNGQLDPMSISGSEQEQSVNVSMKAGEPFELWFPALQNSVSAIEVCASHTSAIDNNIPQTGQNGVLTCLTPGTGLADYPYASGGLAIISASPDQAAHVQITGTRAESASGGDQKYYVSNLTSEHGKVYLVIYMNDNNDKSFEPNNVEYFILNFN